MLKRSETTAINSLWSHKVDLYALKMWVHKTWSWVTLVKRKFLIYGRSKFTLPSLGAVDTYRSDVSAWRQLLQATLTYSTLVLSQCQTKKNGTLYSKRKQAYSQHVLWDVAYLTLFHLIQKKMYSSKDIPPMPNKHEAIGESSYSCTHFNFII